jgi:tRNA modification GTPase
MLEARTDMPVIAISARQEQGVEILEEQIKSMFFAGELSFNDEVYITNIRHKTALEEAYQSLTMVEKKHCYGDAGRFLFHRSDERI